MDTATRLSSGRPYWFYGDQDAAQIVQWCTHCGVGITVEERDERDAIPRTYACYCAQCQHGNERTIPAFVGTFQHGGMTVAYGYDHDTEDCPYCDGTGDNRTDPDYSYPAACYACGGSGISRVAPPRREEEPDFHTDPIDRYDRSY